MSVKVYTLFPIGVAGAILAGLGATLLAFSAPFLPMPMFGLVAIPVAFLAWAMGGSGVLLLAVGEKWTSVGLAALAWAGAGVATVFAVGSGAADLLASNRAGLDANAGALIAMAVGAAVLPTLVSAIGGYLAAGPLRGLATGAVAGVPTVAAMLLLIQLVEYGLPLST